MPVEPAIGLAPSSCSVHACVELAWPGNWGEPERAPHVRVVQRARLYIYYIIIYLSSDLGHGCKMDKMAALCVAVYRVRLKYSPRITSNRRKSYETKQTHQPLPQAKIQVSAEGITPTNLPPRLRISQDPKRSSLQSPTVR